MKSTFVLPTHYLQQRDWLSSILVTQQPPIPSFISSTHANNFLLGSSKSVEEIHNTVNKYFPCLKPSIPKE